MDSDASNLSDIQENNSASDSGKLPSPSLDSSPKPTDTDGDIQSSSHKHFSEEANSTNDQSVITNQKPVDNETIVGELVMGSDAKVLTGSDTSPVASLNLKEADSLGLGVGDIVQECMEEGSEDSRDSLGDELDLTGIDDAEINKVGYTVSRKWVLNRTFSVKCIQISTQTTLPTDQLRCLSYTVLKRMLDCRESIN